MALSTFAISKPFLHHGSLTPVSETAFHHLQLAEQRLFTVVPAAFYLIGVLL